MSVSGTEYLSALDAILYNRPAGRNIIDFAREEIERLRLENDGLKLAVKMRPKPELVDDPRQQAIIAEQKAEIERLHGACASYEAQANRDAIEIERLHEELAVEKGWVSQYRNSYCKQVVEIERLRNALAQSCDDQRQLAREELNFPCEAAMDNEVLRGLLREMLDGYCADNLTQQDVENRVRAALGDKP